MAATVTLRHPGAPRLLAALGLPDASAWLDNGSIAMLTHLALSPGHVRARDFSVAAGALQIAGAFDAAQTAEGMIVTGDVDAPTLALPAWPDLSPTKRDWAWPRGVQAQIGLRAARVLWGLSPVATGASATLRAAGGVVLIQDARAVLPQGKAAGALAVDASQDPPAVSVMASLAGVPPENILPDTPSPPGLALHGGRMGVSAELYGHGSSGAAWLANAAGTLHVDLQGASLAGLDLAGSSSAMASPAPGLRARLQRALMTGETAPLDGSIDAAVRDGVATLGGSRLSGPQGTVDIAGMVDATRASVDLRLVAKPAMAASARLAVSLTGPWRSVHASADLGEIGHGKSRVGHGHRRRTGK